MPYLGQTQGSGLGVPGTLTPSLSDPCQSQVPYLGDEDSYPLFTLSGSLVIGRAQLPSSARWTPTCLEGKGLPHKPGIFQHRRGQRSVAMVRTYMCVHVHSCVYVYICVCVCVCMCECVSMGICVHVCAYMCVCMHAHACVCACMYVCQCMCVRNVLPACPHV